MRTTTEEVEDRSDRRSVRLPQSDYGGPGAYFVTIGTLHRRNLLGAVVDGAMRLSEYGRIADACWRAIPRHFRHAGLGAFVIMPNHVHGILVLEAFYGKRADPVGARQVVPETQADGVLTWAHHGAPLRTAGRIPQAVAGSLGAIIRQYKSSVTREVRAETGRTGPFWQRNYYEHVIRSEFEWWRLHRYIESNPMTWAQDEENAARADIAVADRGSRRS